MSEEENSEAAPAEAAAEAGPTVPQKNPEIVALKTRIGALKSERIAALAAGDTKKLKIARRRIGRLKRKIRKVS